MLWLKLVHIAAVIVWCGALLYLPAVLSSARPLPDGDAPLMTPNLPRRTFNMVATPAALLAIASGTALFLAQTLLAPWLVAKLALVALLVLGHAACGLLLLHREKHPHSDIGGRCAFIVASSLAWLAGIAWLVLRQPR